MPEVFRLEGPFPPAPSCTGGTWDRPCFCQGRRYNCPGCRRFVPWCFGAADEHPELCDDCASVASRREQLKPEPEPKRTQ